jgi:hypothetical protein
MQAERKKFLSGLLTALTFIGSATSGLAHGQSLGRLFFSPQERRELDARRNFKPARPPAVVALPPGKPHAQTVTENKPASAKPVISEPVINGFVRRSSGINTVWVNEAPLTGAAAREELLQPSAVNTPVRVQAGGR